MKKQTKTNKEDIQYEYGRRVGIKEERERIMKIIDDDIKTQKEMIIKYPQHIKSCKWRFIGMENLKYQIKGDEK